MRIRYIYSACVVLETPDVSIVVLTVSGAGFALAIFQSQRDTSAPNLPNVPTISATNEEATNAFIRFTFTAVELREAGGVRWLAIDYLDDVHGEVEKVFMRDSNIPGFKAETRTSEFAGGDKSAPVRHQRVEYRMPNSVPREQLEKFRDTVAKALNQKSIRLKLSEEKELFTLVDDGGALKARIKVMASLKISINSLQLEVHGPKQINQSLWLNTASEAQLGDYLVSLLKRPDGRVEERPAGTYGIRSDGKTAVTTSFYWPMASFESGHIAEIAAGLREKIDGSVVRLPPRQPLSIFTVTNDRGGVIEGSIELRPRSLAPEDKPVISMSIRSITTWPNMLSAYLQINGPLGYAPQGAGVYGDGSEVDTHTSISRNSPANSSCRWNLPPGFSITDADAIARQLETIKVSHPNGLRIAPGDRVPVFALTNRLGTVFRGYFELPTPTATK